MTNTVLFIDAVEVWGPATSIPSFQAVGSISLKENDVTVHEISAQKYGGSFSSLPAHFSQPLELTEAPFAAVYLHFGKAADDDFAPFYAPSHVPSPRMSKVGAISFAMNDYGLTAPGGGKVTLARRMSMHTYLEVI